MQGPGDNWMEVPDWAEEIPDSIVVEVPVHFFDPWLTMESRVVAMVEKYVVPAILKNAPPRKRARKEGDLENLKNIIVALYANLAYALVLAGGRATVVIRREAEGKELVRHKASVSCPRSRAIGRRGLLS